VHIFSPAVLAVFPIVAALAAGGCRVCTNHVETFTLDDAGVARVSEGTGAPTANGCSVVCYESYFMQDVGTIDGGLTPGPNRNATCALTGTALVCDFGRTCVE